jgi:uncharacterized membrane protein
MVTRPGVSIFTEQIENARWGLIWVLLVLLVGIDFASELLARLISAPAENLPPVLGTPFSVLVIVPITFFLEMSLLYL